jgi:hypothetical protein
MGSRSAPMVTPTRLAFLSCLQSVTADICNSLTPAPIHTQGFKGAVMELACSPWLESRWSILVAFSNSTQKNGPDVR